VDSLRLASYPQRFAEVVDANSVAWPPSTEVTGPSGSVTWIGPTSGGGSLEAIVWPLLSRSCPLRRVMAVAVAPDGSVAAGGPDGLALHDGGRWHYFAGRRWLPSDDVRRVLCLQYGELFADTPAGLARIAPRPMRLSDKAAEFERQIAARHDRGGYVTVCFLERPDDLDGFVHEVSDNDGLWTAMYLAAEAFRFAVTGEPEARERAQRSLNALLELERVTGIPGFPARALARKGEPRALLSRGEWHDAADGERIWKGDTSSDEIVGHYFALCVYSDLIADENERAAIRETVRRITDHILDHGFLLVDADGKQTRWGVWAPDQLHSPQWAHDRGLNSLEILSHLCVASHLVGDPRYQEAAGTLIHQHGYALSTLDQKITEPGHVNHSDDELAFLSYYPLLRCETDPHRRALYLASLERSWQIERPERCPLWNIIYGALTGSSCDLEAAAATLREIPLDLRHWDVRNSHRSDVESDPKAGRFGEAQSRTVLPAGERPMIKWNGNPYRLDGGDGGRTEEDGTFFLLPYWMARFHGLFQEE
jgi:hypothetical protein